MSRRRPALDEGVRPGEIVLENASRAFSVKADRGRTLKEMLIGRTRAGGPAPVQALRDVSLRIEPGETVGMVGRNGAGKSSTLRVLSGIVPLNSGRVACGGQIVAQLELGAGFGRDFSGRENIFLNGALHGLVKEQIEERLDAIVEFSELGDFIDAPVATYSSGMFLRLGFSIAAHLDADVLLIDEVLAVGDEAFQRKCEARIAAQIAAGATLVLVSHDPALIERTCERVIVLDGGEEDLRRPGQRGDAVLPPPHGHRTGARRGGDATCAQRASGRAGMKPEEALAAARAAAAERDDGLPAGTTIEPTERVSIEQLMEWANIEPDVDLMRSTRKLGAPITWAKRQLVHVLRQYLRELQSQQTRFNLNLLIRVAELEDRVARLEERAPDGASPPAAPPEP